MVKASLKIWNKVIFSNIHESPKLFTILRIFKIKFKYVLRRLPTISKIKKMEVSLIINEEFTLEEKH